MLPTPGCKSRRPVDPTTRFPTWPYSQPVSLSGQREPRVTVWDFIDLAFKSTAFDRNGACLQQASRPLGGER